MSFIPAISAQETTISDAINSGDITTTIASTGAASGHIADMRITSAASSEITLDLDNSGLYGMVLENPYAGEQDEVISDTPGVYTSPVSPTFNPASSVTLAPGETVKIPVIGYCLNFDLATPTAGIEFTITPTSTKTDINQISTVLDTLETYSFPSGYSTNSIQTVTQLAIWTGQSENINRPLQDYTDRDYEVNDNELSTIRDILNQSGINTDNIATFTGETLVSDDGFLGFPWGYPWGYPWGLPLGDIPCYFFVITLVPLLIIIMISIVRRSRKKPKDTRPPPRQRKRKYTRPPRPQAVSKTKPKNCDELIRKCKNAYKEAEAAKQKADSAKKAANKAYFDFQEAGEALTEAQEELRDVQEKPLEEGSWIEMDETRITSSDLKLREDAAKKLWDQFRQGDIDAKALENGWEDLGEHDALKELRNMDKEAREKKASKVVDLAKERVADAKLTAEETKAAVTSAVKRANKAKELSNRLCKAANDCVKRAQATTAKVATKPPAKVTGKEDLTEGPEEEPEVPDEESEETEETTEATEETTEEIEETSDKSLEKKDKKEKKEEGEPETGIVGVVAPTKSATTYFGPRLGEPGLEPTRTRPKKGDETQTRGGGTETPPEDSSIDTPPTAAVAKDEPKSPRCGPDVTDMYLKALNDIASRLRHEYRSAPGGAWTDFWGARAAYGISFLAVNGMEMDFYVPTSSGCPTQKCQHTVTLMGECVVAHTLNDLIYGLCAGFFGVPSCIQKAGGHFAEYISYGSWDPEVSQQIYNAGSELGEMIRDKPIDIGKSDLGVTVMKIDLIIKPDCLPCPKPAVGTIDGHDFTKHDWIWP